MERLFDVCESARNQNVFFIFDLYRYPELKALWEALRYRNDAVWRYLYQSSHYDGYLARSPLILPIENGNPGETLFLALNDIAGDIDDAGMVVVTPAGLDAFHQHWLYWINAVNPDGQPIHIPLFHPSIFKRLWTALDPSDRPLLLGPQSAVYAPRRNASTGQCLVTPMDCTVETSQLAPSTAATGTCYQYHQQTLDRLFYPERLESLIRGLHKKYCPQQAVTLEQVRTGFHQGMALARQRYPQSGTLDWETFAIYRFLLGNRFYDHPAFHQIYGASSLRDKIARFRDTMQHRPAELKPYTDKDWL